MHKQYLNVVAGSGGASFFNNSSNPNTAKKGCEPPL